MMKDSWLMERRHWSTLHASLSSICRNSIERNAPKTPLVGCRGFWPLLRTQADWQSDVSWDRCTWWGENCGRHVVFGGYKRTQGTVMEAELGLLIELSCAMFVGLHSLLIFASLRHSWELLLESLLAPAADSCLLLSWLYRTGLLVYLWSVSKWIKLLLLTCALNCWFPDNTEGSCSTEPF